MTKKISLNAEARDLGVKADSVRADGYVPGVVYGGQEGPVAIKIKQLDFQRTLEQAGESTLVDLSIGGGESVKALIKDVDKDVVRGQITHCDLYRVDMSKPIEVEVPLDFVGVSKAVADLGGVLVKSKETVAVKCLPKDLLEKIEIDLGRLENIGDMVSVEDLKLDERYEIMDSPSDVIVGVSEVEQYVEAAPAPSAAEGTAEGEAAPAEGGEKKEEGADTK